MRQLLREIRRAARATHLEIRARWHASRLDRARALEQHHEAALADRLADARHLLATR